MVHHHAGWDFENQPMTQPIKLESGINFAPAMRRNISNQKAIGLTFLTTIPSVETGKSLQSSRS
jgi:hypothetical protein